MNNWASKILTLTILGCFTLSLISLEYFHPRKTNNLKDLIITVQEFEKSTDDSTSDFQIVFSNVISTLQDTASVYDLVSPRTHTDNSKPETVRIIVKTRIPYLLSDYEPVRKIEFYQTIIPAEPISLYQSHSVLPEIPPPLVS